MGMTRGALRHVIPGGVPTDVGRSGRWAVALAGLLLAGCANQALERVPASPDVPWRAQAVRDTGTTLPQAPEVTGFGVPAVPLPALDAGRVTVNPAEPLDLSRLIDIAQRENAETRQAWNRAREAALSVGVVEATFLPVLSANVLSGQQRVSTPSPLIIDGSDSIRTRISGTVPALALSWLLFDFGGRRALLEGAEQLAFAANVLFNATHQKIIRDVTDFYYQYDAARVRVRHAHEALTMRERIAEATQARMAGGVGTVVEVALAKQGIAQARLHVITSEGLERTTYLSLLGAMGLAPTAQITVAPPAQQVLPTATDPMTQDMIDQALSRRPDLVAAYAAMQAAQAGVQAAESAFMPKVFVGSVWASRHTSFDIRGLPSLSQQSTSTGFLVGVSLPLYDGGLRRNNVSKAQIHLEQAADTLQSRQRGAVREMAVAETGLRTALQSAEAARELEQTAQVAYDAALAAYDEGVGTITLVNEATTHVLQAKQARLDAHNASLVSAANLAFVTGAMIRSQEHWLPDGGSPTATRSVR